MLNKLKYMSFGSGYFKTSKMDIILHRKIDSNKKLFVNYESSYTFL